MGVEWPGRLQDGEGGIPMAAGHDRNTLLDMRKKRKSWRIRRIVWNVSQYTIHEMLRIIFIFIIITIPQKRH